MFVISLRKCFQLFRRRLWKRIVYLAFLCIISITCFLVKRNSKGNLHDIFVGDLDLRLKLTTGLNVKHQIISSKIKSSGNAALFFPLCFGQDLCQHFSDGTIKIGNGNISYSSSWSSGLLKESTKIEASSVDLYDWKEFLTFMCTNNSFGVGCDIRNELSNQVSSSLFLTTSNLQLLHLRLKKMRYDLPLLICTTDTFVAQLKKAFDDNKNGELDLDEQLALITSLVLKPDLTLMKFSKSTGSSFPIPNVLGSCGRVVVREANWMPLANYLNESFDVRAGIAIQVLQTIETLQGEDTRWFFFNTEFSFDSFGVSKDGEVILINLKSVAVVDKSSFLPNVPNIFDTNKICNELCFQKFSNEILFAKNTSTVCPEIQFYGQLMYALACRELLSNLEEHKLDSSSFSFDGHIVHKPSFHSGLLHTIPKKDKETIEDLLRECVQETSFGGRKQAVEELRDVLEKYLNFEDHDEDSQLENDRKDSRYEYEVV